MTITDPQIRETLAGLVAAVEAERNLLIESHTVFGSEECTVELDDAAAATVAHWNALIAGGKVVIEELDRRADELARLHAAGGALA